MPASNVEFWNSKFARNQERDGEAREALLRSGWRVAIVWECAIQRTTSETLAGLSQWIRSEVTSYESVSPDA
jgi:DNA mismatch endonuclease (patch repair protein)